MIQVYASQIDEMSAECMILQENLIRWYNFNLKSTDPEVGFERYFDSVVNIVDGMIGYIEIPKWKQKIPIYHDFRKGSFHLNCYSAFPSGRAGDHAELIIDRPLRFLEGDIFRVYILDSSYTYEIGSEGNSQCDLICDGIRYAGAGIVED